MLRKAIFLVIAACVDRGGHCEPVAAARGAEPLKNGPFAGSVPKFHADIRNEDPARDIRRHLHGNAAFFRR